MKALSIGFTKDAKLRKLGKSFMENEQFVMAWPDSGFVFRMNGSYCVFHFADYADDQPAYVKVWVDGQPRRYGISDGREKIVIDGLNENAAHEIRILRVTEGLVPLCMTKIELFGSYPALLDAPEAPERKLYFIGDSLTCGYGNRGPVGEKDYFTYEEDSSCSYAYLTAERLCADICMTGSSGKGIVADCTGDRSKITLRQAFSWKTPTGGVYEFSSYQPDVIIVNAGTNDAWGGVPPEELRDGVVTFLKEIRAVYPGKPILYVYGFMDQSALPVIKEAVAAAESQIGNLFFLPVDSMYQLPAEEGAAGHPNLIGANRVSRLVADTILEILSR